MRLDPGLLDFLKRFFVSRTSPSTIAATLSPDTDLAANLGEPQRRFDVIYANRVIGNVSMDMNMYNSIKELHNNNVASGEPTGFSTRASTYIDFSNTTRTFGLRLQMGYTEFSTWIQGRKVTYEEDQTVVLPDTTGLYFIYFDDTNVLVASTSVWDLSVTVPVATVYWNTTTDLGLVGDERHGLTMDWVTHEYLHKTIGARYGSGLNATIDSSSFTISSGTLFDEDLKHTISEQTSGRILYRNGSDWEWATSSTLFYQVSDIIQYDNAGTLTNVSDNYYVAYWVFATNDDSYPIYSIMGQRQDVNLNNARLNNTYESLSFGTLPFVEFKVLYRVIFRRSGTSETYTETQDLRSVSNVPAGTYVATDHGTLSGLTDLDHPASAIIADTTNFANNLSSSDDTVQKALDTLDNIVFTKQALFTVEGTLSTGSKALKIPNVLGETVTISKVYLIVGTAPTGAALIVDIHKDGTTIFTTQSNRPQISAGSTSGYTTTIDVSSWADGSYLTMDIDQIGSTVAGSDLTVAIVYA